MNNSSKSTTEAGSGGGGVTPTNTRISHSTLYHHTSIKNVGNIPPKVSLPHPHAGARYPNRTYGYVADVTAVRKRHFQKLHEWEIAKGKTNATVTSSSSGNRIGNGNVNGTDQEETFSFASRGIQLHMQHQHRSRIRGCKRMESHSKSKGCSKEGCTDIGKDVDTPSIVLRLYLSKTS